MTIKQTEHLELRPSAQLVIEWDPNSGQLQVAGNGASVMEQIGMLTYAIAALRDSTNRKEQPLVQIPRIARI